MSGLRKQPVLCAAWGRGTKPCRNRAKYEAHITEANWYPVCERHKRNPSISHLVILA